MSSDFENDLAPQPNAVEWVQVGNEPVDEIRLKTGKYSFSQALAIIEKHRMAVQATVGVALVGRLLLEFDLFTLLIDSRRLLAAVPQIGIALLAYLVVLWFMAARTRDRYAFGMALGIGVLQGTYGFAQVVMLRPWAFGVAFSWFMIGLAHATMAGAAIHASTAYPPFDTKRPWIVGFATAVGLITLGWLVPVMT